MTIISNTAPRIKYHPNAYRFIGPALRYSQSLVHGNRPQFDSQEEAHVTGQEFLEGIRAYAQDQFGLLAKTVFNCWGIYETEDFGRIVFELIESGEMKKTEDDELGDFCDLFDFEEAFVDSYPFDVSRAFLP